MIEADGADSEFSLGDVTKPGLRRQKSPEGPEPFTMLGTADCTHFREPSQEDIET